MRIPRSLLAALAAVTVTATAVACAPTGETPRPGPASSDATADAARDVIPDDEGAAADDDAADVPADGAEVQGAAVGDAEVAGSGYGDADDAEVDPDTEEAVAVAPQVYAAASERLAGAAPASELARVVGLDPDAATTDVPDQDLIGFTGAEALVVHVLSEQTSLIVTVGPDGQFIDDPDERDATYSGGWEEVAVTGVGGAYRYEESGILGLVMQLDGKDVVLNLSGGTVEQLPVLAAEVAAGLAS